MTDILSEPHYGMRAIDVKAVDAGTGPRHTTLSQQRSKTIMRSKFASGRLAIVLAALLSTAACFSAVAAEWKPDKKVVEVVVPNAPGGGNDRVVRLVIKIAQEQRLVDAVMNVVNKPGAGIVMGMNYLNQHPGDANYV